MLPSRLTFCLCIAATAAALTGCARFPELDAAVTEQAKEAPNPKLMDNHIALATAAGTTLEPEDQEAIEARAKDLRTRTKKIDGPVIPRSEKKRISEATNRLEEASARVAPVE